MKRASMGFKGGFNKTGALNRHRRLFKHIFE
jgi:hypothetical protein